MTLVEVLTLVISAIAIAISLIALFFNNRANKMIMTQTEVLIRNMISDARHRLLVVTHENKENELKIRPYLENYLNVYNEACSKYYANKIDKKYFQAMYREDIISLFKQYNSASNFQTRWKYLHQVYTDWIKL